jgi:hypothetical protein
MWITDVTLTWESPDTVAAARAGTCNYLLARFVNMEEDQNRQPSDHHYSPFTHSPIILPLEVGIGFDIGELLERAGSQLAAAR